MARWSSQKQDAARERILAAARDAFETHGFAGAKMRQIAADAGVAVGTLFNYFPDKLTLLREALYEDMADVTEHLVGEAGRDAQDLPEVFLAFARPSFEHFCRRPNLSKVLLRESLFSEGPRAADYGAQATTIGAAMMARVSELQARGGLRADARPDVVTLAFFSHYYFILMTQLGVGELDVLLRQISLLAHQLEAGVGVS